MEEPGMTLHPLEADGGGQECEGGERSYFRVPTWLEVRCRVVGSEEAERLEAQILGQAPLDLSLLEPSLAIWLQRIEEKLDHLLTRLDPDAPVSIALEGLQEVALSGAGMSFGVRERVESGAILALEFVLPGAPGRRVHCLADIAAAADAGGQPPARLAVAFRVIHEADRDAIVRHVLEVQRSQILSRGDQGERS